MSKSIIYKTLNKLAEQDGIVLFGSNEDLNIPMGELKQAFSIESNMYNRSFEKMSIVDAISLYDQYIMELNPETIILHIGNDDLELFKNNPSSFNKYYCDLIDHIRCQNKKCHLGIVSIKNPDNNPEIDKMNAFLETIASTKGCEFEDISHKRLWNPIETKETMSFIYSIGYVRPLKTERSIYDLAKILFNYDSSMA